MARTLAAYLYDAASLDVAAFCEKHPHPVLVAKPHAMESEPQLSTSAGGESNSGVPLVYVLKAGGAHGFGDRITLGRTGNNDVAIQAPDISKYHGFLTQSGALYAYADAGSTYGSFLNGKRLASGERTTLTSHDVLTVASVELTFYDPAALHSHLRAISQRDGA